MSASMAYWGEDFCLIHGRHHMRSWMGNPIPFCQACEEGWKECERCQGGGYDSGNGRFEEVCEECDGLGYFTK